MLQRLATLLTCDLCSDVTFILRWPLFRGGVFTEHVTRAPGVKYIGDLRDHENVVRACNGCAN